MKKRMIMLGVAVLVLFAGIGFAFYTTQHTIKSSTAQTKMKTDGEGVQIRVEFENEHVKVLRYHLAPHATMPWHDAPELVAVWLTNAHLRLTLSNGTTIEEKHQAGAVGWSAPQRHTGVNLSDTPLEFISVQLKSSALHTIAKTDGGRMENGDEGVQVKVEFENDHVRVLRYHFAPHATIPMHDAPELVAVWLTNAHFKLTLPDGTTKEEEYRAGAVAWNPPQRHTGVNLSGTPLEFVSVQL